MAFVWENPLIDPQRLNSLSLQLKSAGAQQLNDALEEILHLSEELDWVVPIVISKLNEGFYIADQHLVNLLNKTKDSNLYSKVRVQIFENLGQLLNLYKAKYPDKDIEQVLCTRLYEIATNDGNPLRRDIVDAMAEVASGDVVPTLEALIFDLLPLTKVRQAFPEAYEPLVVLETKSRLSFLQKAEMAIDIIKKRESNAVYQSHLPLVEGKKTGIVVEISDPSSTMELVQRLIDEGLPVLGVMLLRRETEALAKGCYRRLGHEQKGKPAKKMTLEELLKPLKDGGAPEVLMHLLQTLQLFGNFAAHDQGEQSKHLTKEIACALLVLYQQAILSKSTWIGDIDQP